MGGISNVKSQLFANPPEGQLQVTARRRKTATATNTIVAGTVGGTTVLNVVLDAADTLQPNDAILFDFVLAELSATATGVNLVSMAFLIEDTTQTKFIPIAQPILTVIAIPVTPPSGVITNPQPALWTSNDIGFGLESLPEPVPPVDQPLKLTLLALGQNTTAAAINLTTKLLVFYRIVRGLQEG